MAKCMVGLLMTSTAAITLTDVSVSYNNLYALENISGIFAQGSLTAIVGPNGGGKSTLLKAMMGFEPKTSGNIEYYNGENNRAYLPQSHEIDRTFPLTVHDVVSMGLCQRAGFYGDFQSIPSLLCKIMNTLGLQDIGDRSLSDLSGGQFQRVLFARLAMQQASLIMLDEPFSAIDAATVKDLMQIIMKWHSKGKTIVMVTHDLELVRRFFPQTVMLARQCIAWGDTSAVLVPANTHKMQNIYNNYCARPFCHSKTAS